MKAVNITVFTYSYQPDANTPATSVGVLAFGAHQEEAFYAFAGLSEAGTRYGREQIEIVLMNDLPGWFTLVRDGVKELSNQLARAGLPVDPYDMLKQVVAWNEGKTFHVSHVEDIEVEFASDMGAAVIAQLNEMLDKGRGYAGEKFVYGFMTEVSIPENKLLN